MGVGVGGWGCGCGVVWCGVGWVCGCFVIPFFISLPLQSGFLSCVLNRKCTINVIVHVLGKHISKKTQLYQSNIKIQGFIHRASF